MNLNIERRESFLMQQDSLAINNSINIVGKVSSGFTFSHEVYGEGFYTFSVDVSRLSDISDKLPITISERLIDKDKLSIGTMVHILGQVRSYNSFVEVDKKNKLVLTIFTKDIKLINEDNNIQTKNPNEVYLNGYICKPTIFRTTPFGREIADILLAVNRSYNKSDYIPCIAWGRNARFVSNLEVGNNIKLTGRMQSRGYQKKLETGNVLEKVAFEVSVSKLEHILKS